MELVQVGLYIKINKENSMKIRQDPITKLYCRSDGAILMPPVKHTRFKSFRWTFGSKTPNGYKQVRFCGKIYQAHQIVCRAFNGLAPIDRPEVDHINRIKSDNRPENLHWANRKENNNNKDYIDRSIEKYGVRACEDKAAWGRAYRETRREECRARSKNYEQAQRAKGLTHRKGPDGKWSWLPRKQAYNKKEENGTNKGES